MALNSFFGLNLTHNRSDLYRSIFEGIAYGTKHVFDTFDELNNLPKRLYSVGGGTNNKLWSQTTSDIIGLEQIIRQKTIGASYGDAFLSAFTLGDVKRDDINLWNKIDYKILPKKNNTYVKGYKNFRKLYFKNQTSSARKSRTYIRKYHWLRNGYANGSRCCCRTGKKFRRRSRF